MRWRIFSPPPACSGGRSSPAPSRAGPDGGGVLNGRGRLRGRLAEAVLAFGQEGEFLRGRGTAEDRVAMRKPAEALDDFEMQPRHPAVARPPRHRRDRQHQLQPAALILQIFAVLERHVEEQPPSRRHGAVDPASVLPAYVLSEAVTGIVFSLMLQPDWSSNSSLTNVGLGGLVRTGWGTRRS